MNFDYIEIAKSLGKDRLCLDYLDWQFTNKYGWNKYEYEGCKVLEVWHHSESNDLKVKGSLPYFITGQNFHSEMKDFRDGITYLSDIIETDLLDGGEVKAMEFGTILEIPFSPREVFNSHIRMTGKKARTYDNGKYFVDSNLKVKLYDAGRNMKLKLDKVQRRRLEDIGYDPLANYVKIENHYLRPSIYFMTRSLKLNTLLTDQFQSLCKKDLLHNYNSIMKTSRAMATDKKHLSSSTIPLLVLMEYEELLPCKAEELIKRKIKQIPEAILTKEDKKARARQIRENFKKIKLDKCEYDLTPYLMARL